MSSYNRQLLRYLSDYVTENKQGLIEANLDKRTRYVSVLLEDIYKPHNASAVLRTCDCLGVQDIHIVEGDESYDVNPYVVRGAAKWVDIYKYPAHTEQRNQGTISCLKELKEKGYRIMATSPHKDGLRPEEVPIDSPVVFALGNEHAGLSETILDMADGYVQIPQVGFTESYNLSVTASLCLYSFITRLWSSTTDWKLSENEKEALKLKWYRECVKNVEIHERLFSQSYTE